jgi:hypothetical protein
MVQAVMKIHVQMQNFVQSNCRSFQTELRRNGHSHPLHPSLDWIFCHLVYAIGYQCFCFMVICLSISQPPVEARDGSAAQEPPRLNTRGTAMSIGTSRSRILRILRVCDFENQSNEANLSAPIASACQQRRQWSLVPQGERGNLLPSFPFHIISSRHSQMQICEISLSWDRIMNPRTSRIRHGPAGGNSIPTCIPLERVIP